ncbi:putative acetyltransferase [Nocardioides albertanoniae]|uniref:Putative acetyltransferase n=1 Tax=Nocardioides albertanoniae TaxID=1175486 RepID=A0A543A5E8_9ACTN|nr:GNAT family N-acetyltransferase [Nocardioides albertanoniae]TQL67706.1 putative acetyltransferase [Nocardioides albertanoniae]
MTYALRPVSTEAEWGIVAWLWQDFRHDLAPVVNGFPLADGRYRHEWLDEYPASDRCGYLAWAPHPDTGEDAPIGFALVRGLGLAERIMQAFFVVPAARRGGFGRKLALDVIARHPGPWAVPFQHDNAAAVAFWPAVATQAWGQGWTETTVPVADKPDLPPDHWIRTS